MTSNITAGVFLTFFREFCKVPTATLDLYLQTASCRVPLRVWCENTSYGTALLTAHMLCTQGHGGEGAGGGAVNNEAVGDLSRGFDTVFEIGSGDAALMTTRYGIDFIALRSETVMGVTAGVTSRPRCW
jgi:hypothetical protein